MEASASSIAAALQPLADTKGVSFCRYADESKNNNNAKVIHGPVEGVESCHELLGALQGVLPSLAFTKSQMRDALQSVLSVSAGKWKLTGKQQEDWVDTMARLFVCFYTITSRQDIQFLILLLFLSPRQIESASGCYHFSHMAI